MKGEFLSGRKIWLASRSPRRKELLSRITPDFTVKVSRFDEAPLMAQAGSVPPEELVKALSAGKARAVWEELGAPAEGLVIGGWWSPRTGRFSGFRRTGRTRRGCCGRFPGGPTGFPPA